MKYISLYVIPFLFGMALIQFGFSFSDYRYWILVILFSLNNVPLKE